MQLSCGAGRLGVCAGLVVAIVSLVQGQSPTVTSVTPSSSLNDGPVQVTIDGSNFTLGWGRENGLDANWPMEEPSGSTVADVSGGGHTGTASGTTIVTGQIGNARLLNGSSDYIGCGNNSALNYTTGNFSISAWVRRDTAGGTIVQRGAGTQHGYTLMIHDGTHDFHILTHNGGYTYIWANTIPNVWQHWVAVRAGSTFTIYLNGSQVSTGSAGNAASSTAHFEIGRGDYWGYFGGPIDEVRVYGRAVSASEAAQLAAATQKGAVKLTRAGYPDIPCMGAIRPSATQLTNCECDITGSEGGLWNVVVTNPNGQTGMLPNGFEIVTPCPTVVDDPSGDTLCVGDAAVMTVTADGAEPLSYQWRRNGVDLTDGGAISGATTDTLTLDPVAAGDGGDYDVLVSNTCGTDTSSTAQLIVLGGGGQDCDSNGQLDECETYSGAADDCNTNGVPDECDIDAGASLDCDADGTPDDCQPASGVFQWTGNDGDEWSLNASWDRNDTPGVLAHAALSNTGAADNRCIYGLSSTVCGLTVEGSGPGRQILRMTSGAELTIVNDASILAGGHLELRGGTLHGNSLLNASNSIDGHGTIDADLFNEGDIRGHAGENLLFVGGSLHNEPGGLIESLIASFVHVQSPQVEQQGSLSIRPGGNMLIDSAMENGNVIDLLGGVLAVGGLTNLPGGVLMGFGSLDSHLTNQGHINVVADLQIVGNLTNDGTVNIQSGLLTVTGSVSGSGTIIGGFGGRDGDSNGLTVRGDFLPSVADWRQFDLSHATLQFDGDAVDGPQHLEVMASDHGAGVTLPDATMYSIGTLRIGPSSTTVRLLDNYENKGAGSAARRTREALYVRRLVLDPGVTLDLGGLRLYYETVSSENSVAEGNGVSVIDSAGGGGLTPIHKSEPYRPEK